MSARSWLVAAALVAAVPALPAVAHADEREEAQALFRAGEKAFDATQYIAAADAFEAALAKLPLPAIAFSAAQAHRLQYFVDNNPQHLQRAVVLYHQYIDQQKTGGRVADAVANLAQIEPLLRELGAQGTKGADIRATATRIVVIADVAGAKAMVDADSGPVPFVHDVAVGEHTVTVTADGFATFTRKATAVDGEMVPVEVALVALPAKLVIASPRGAHVSVDARELGDAPLAGVEVPAGKHYLVISERGRLPFARDLDLQRGQTLTLSPALAKTRQRRAVPWVVAGGAGLAVAAAVTGVLAHSAQADAEKQLAALSVPNASPQAVLDYNRDLSTRNSRVHDTEVLGVAAGAVLVTGALLYLLDNPSPEVAPPPIAPVVGAKSAGIAFGGRF